MKPTYEQLLAIAKVAYRIGLEPSGVPTGATWTHVSWRNIRDLRSALTAAGYYGPGHRSPEEAETQQPGA
jgi:hypothetical protein